MREEVQRIIKMVQEGKLSPEDAADLIDAFSSSEQQENTPPPPPPGAAKDPFRSFVETMEKFGQDASQSVKWNEVAEQIRVGTKKGVEAMRSGLEEVAKGRINFQNLFSLAETKEVCLPLVIPSGKDLRIENLAGNVKVAGGFDNGTVTARARFRGITQEEARNKATNYTLIIEESDHQVLIRQPDVTGLSVDLDIQMSGTGNVEVKCDSGDVTILDTRGGARLALKHGDVHLKGLQGLIELNSSSGDVSVEDSQATSLSIENKSGNIILRRVVGTVNVRSASGDIEAYECSGRVFSLEAVSGDVLLDLAETVSGQINVRTVSGDAQISIVDGSDCRVNMSTLRGTAVSDIALTDESKTEQRITGRLGNGNGILDVSAVSGDIHLKLRDQISSE